MKIILFGKNGQLGMALQDAFIDLPHEITVLSREEVNFEEPETLAPLIQKLQPDIIINAAAYTLVDQAEDEPQCARTVNTVAPSVIAKEAHKLGAWLIHYSTDYVYDGGKPSPYIESDKTNPLSIYGQSKCDGDELIAANHDKYIIFRTSWCYSLKGKNFAKTILQLAQTKDSLSIVSDQVGAPTSTDRIAIVTKDIIQKITNGLSPLQSGIYHLVSGGETSWYDYACFLVQEAAKYHLPLTLSVKNISPVFADDYKAKAKRPQNSRLDTDKIRTKFKVTLPHWQEDVSVFIKSYCQSLLTQKGITHDKS